MCRRYIKQALTGKVVLEPVGIVMHGDRMWASGMSRPMSQKLLGMVVRACQNIKEVVSARGRRKKLLRRLA